jgi:manganese/zinc/iron transport system permease protein
MSALPSTRAHPASLIGLLALVLALAGMIAAAEFWDLWPRAAEALGIQYNTLIVLVGTGLLGASAGLVGSFAVLRRQALMGDALSHAALPGICLAFLWQGERNLPVLLSGALGTGLAGVASVAALRRWTRIKEDAAIGIVLSVFFGAGLALSRVIQNTTTTGSKAGLDSYILGKTAGMISQDVTWIASLSLVSLLVVLLFYKEFKLAAFDSGFASAQGWPALVLDLAMMGLVAVTVVLGLPAVGVVLMAALLILPGAAARFWTDRLGRMLVLSALFGVLIGVLGTSISANYGGSSREPAAGEGAKLGYQTNPRAPSMPAGPIIVLVGTGVFLASVLFAPRRGGLARLAASIALRRRIQEQKLLRTLFELAESRGGSDADVELRELLANKAWTPGLLRRRLSSLTNEQLVEARSAERYRLTPAGVRRAAQVVRAHRLWQLFLERNAELASSLADLDLDALDEQLTPETIAELEAELAALGRLPKEALP